MFFLRRTYKVRNVDVRVERGTILQQTRRRESFKTGDIVEALVGGAPVEQLAYGQLR